MSTSAGKTCIYSPMRSEDDARGRDTKMNAFYVRAGETGKPVSRIFLGTAGAPYASGREANALLDEMFAAGITAYDTARKYDRAEECLGKWICSRRNREKIFLLTKCGHPGPLGNARVNRRAMRADLERSLSALKTDYVDALLLHRDDERVPVGEVVEIFNEMFREGKIRAFGGSNWRHERIAAANAYAEQKGMRPFSFSSPNFGLAVQVKPDEEELIEFCGTLLYMAPEILSGEDGYSFPADVFAFGIILYQLVTGQDPDWFDKVPERIPPEGVTMFFYNILSKEERPKIPDHVPEKYRQIISECWQAKPDARPTMADVVRRLLDAEPLDNEDQELYQDFCDVVRGALE